MIILWNVIAFRLVNEDRRGGGGGGGVELGASKMLYYLGKG